MIVQRCHGVKLPLNLYSHEAGGGSRSAEVWGDTEYKKQEQPPALPAAG